MHHQRLHRKGFGPMRHRRFPKPDELLRLLEEHQRDLEEEAADVAELIRRLKEGRPSTASI
jgi:hypothetical protein